MNPLTCQAAVHAASDQLAGLLPDAERDALEDHPVRCSCLMDQLRSTITDAQVICPDNDLVSTGAYGVVDAALTELDPLDAGLITLIDIDGAPFSQAVIELDLPSGEARDRLARARLAVRAALDRYLQS